MQRVRYRGPCTCTHVLSESVNMLNRRQQWRRIRPRVVLRTRVPDDITCQQLHVHVLVARCACPGIRQCTSDKSHPRRTSQDPRSRKGEALVVARRPPGFRSRRAESPTARPTERPSVSKQASKQAQQRNNLDVAHACFEERMPRSSSSAVSERLLPALPAMGI